MYALRDTSNESTLARGLRWFAWLLLALSGIAVGAAFLPSVNAWFALPVGLLCLFGSMGVYFAYSLARDLKQSGDMLGKQWVGVRLPMPARRGDGANGQNN
jgi:predicted permease